MSEIERIARLLRQTFEGKPYYGPSVLNALEHVTAGIARQKPCWSAHSIWEIVAHLTAESIYAREVIEGTAGSWDESSTWPETADISETAWEQTIEDLKKANRALMRVVKKLEDDILDQKLYPVRRPFYILLHGTIHHNVFHAGEISLLCGQISLSNEE